MSTEESPPVEIMPSMQLLAEAAQEQEKLPEPEPTLEDDDDDRSSSLSELEDRAGTEGSEDAEDDLSEGGEEEEEEAGLENDDDEEEEEDNEEAEHNQPEDVAAEEDDEANDTEAETERLQDSPEKRRPSRTINLRASDVLQVPEENLDQTSEISALSDSEPEGLSRMDSIVGSPRKRKRDEQESDEEDNTVRSLKKVSRKLEDHVHDEDEDDDEHDRSREDRDDDDDASERQASSKELTPEPEAASRPPEKEDDDEGSAADEAEAEEADAEAEAHAKSEEDAAKKEAALSELRSIEKDFALLRDKLFAEKSQRLVDELDLLRNNAYAHTEFSIAAAAIQRRMEEQKQLAVVHFEYSIRNLQNICLAERTMAHSQYMQTVRESREKALDQAGHDWYRIQRERRQTVDDDNDKRYHYHKDRPAQVAAQTAYNREVSILAGLQKYVGFPAAPTVDGVPEAERNDDLKRMGISTKPIHSVPISAPISSFPRQQHRADETFLERNPWANPAQVQVYAAQAMNAPQQSNATSNFTTPAAGRKQGDPQPQNSASTIAISSVEQTPMSNQAQASTLQRPQVPNSDGPLETPSRNTGVSRPDLAITEASPATNGSASKNGLTPTQPLTNGINGLSVAKAADEISPRSSPLKTTQVQAVPAGSS